MGFSGVTKRMYQDGVKNLLKISIPDEHHLYLELLVSRSSTNSQTFVVAYGEFTFTLEDVMKQNMLPLFSEARPIKIVLEENNQVKLKYLTVTMAASRMCGKSTYPTCL